MSAIAWITTAGVLFYLFTLAFAIHHAYTIPIERIDRNTATDAVPPLIFGYILATFVHMYGVLRHLMDTAVVQLFFVALLYSIGALIASVMPLRIMTTLVSKHRSQNV